MSFTFNFKKEHLAEIIKGNPNVDEWYEALVNVLPTYEINTPNRVSAFLAQCAHESGGFRTLKENLNYRADSLLKVFPKYFKTLTEAQQFERKQDKIANRVYANRMGNGTESSGDGWKYCGRGLIQLTGKSNYKAFADSIKMDLEKVPDYLGTFEGAVKSACWFWKTNNLNQWADKDDILTMTKKINGGTIGLDDRKKHYEHAKQVLGNSVVTTTQYETVRLGSKNETVRAVQRALGLKEDGDFGPGTEKAVKSWQASNGLTADGIMGPKSLTKLLG